MTISNEGRAFFTKLSKVWQNFKDYTYLEGINLSPEQISIVEQDGDQLLIEGYAGTGKSLTLLYKFINVLVREENKKILFVTYNSTLIYDTKKRLKNCKEYIENKDRHTADIMTFHEMATKILKQIKVIDKGIGRLRVEEVEKFKDTVYRRIAGIVDKYTDKTSEIYNDIPSEERLYSTHDIKFIVEEIAWIKAMGFTKLDKYISTERTGRSKSIRLTRNQRKTIYKIYEEYQKALENKKFGESLDLEDYALKVLENDHLLSEDIKYDYIFVDEVQDLDPMQIMALCKLTKKSIVLSGDAKQRIYKKCPIKYEDLGLMVKQKGKRKLLNKNYRSTAQIVTLANELKFSDSENKDIKLTEKQFVKEGDRPVIKVVKNDIDTIKYLVKEIKAIQNEDPLKTIAIVHREEVKQKVRSKSDFRLKLEQKLLQSLIDINNYSNKFDLKKEKQIFYTNAYDIKGLEFDVVFILDFNKIFYPNKKEIQKIKEKNDGKDDKLINEDIIEFIENEKKLLYVAMTRAKEKLFIIANGCQDINNISEFVFDFKFKDYINLGFTERDIEKARIKYMYCENGKIYKEKENLKDKKNIQNSDNLKEYNKLILNKEIVEEDGININDIDNIKLAINEKIETNVNENDEYEIKSENKNINKYNLNYIKSDNIKEQIDVDDIDRVDMIIKPKLNKLRIKFIDNRSKKGAFWIVGGLEIKNIIKDLSKDGFVFKFKKEGGKSTNKKPSWWLMR